MGVVLAAVALGALAVKAAHGGQAVGALVGRAPVAQARLDQAYYRCLDIQAHSLVSPGRPVLIEGPDFGAYVVLLKAVGSWVTLAGHPSSSAVALSLDDRRGPGSCLGNVVVARRRGPGGRTEIRVGSGASVPGTGPPPAPPL